MNEDGTSCLVTSTADDNGHSNMADYLKYVREPANGYVSVSFPVADGVEISSWTGR